MFWRSVEEDAISWYKGLPNWSINIFEDLKGKFYEAFSQLIKRKIDNRVLLNIRQRESENLRDYVKRFSGTLSKVIHLDDSATIMAFQVGLKPSGFAISLYNKKHNDFIVIMERVYNEMEVEDMLKEKYKEMRAQKNGLAKNFKKGQPTTSG